MPSIVRHPYKKGTQERDPNLENHPCALLNQLRVQGLTLGFRIQKVVNRFRVDGLHSTCRLEDAKYRLCRLVAF